MAVVIADNFLLGHLQIMPDMHAARFNKAFCEELTLADFIHSNSNCKLHSWYALGHAQARNTKMNTSCQDPKEEEIELLLSLCNGVRGSLTAL